MFFQNKKITFFLRARAHAKKKRKAFLPTVFFSLVEVDMKKCWQIATFCHLDTIRQCFDKSEEINIHMAQFILFECIGIIFHKVYNLVIWDRLLSDLSKADAGDPFIFFSIVLQNIHPELQFFFEEDKEVIRFRFCLWFS